jgi:hypothetical protein
MDQLGGGLMNKVIIIILTRPLNGFINKYESATRILTRLNELNITTKKITIINNSTIIKKVQFVRSDIRSTELAYRTSELLPY